MSAQTQATIEFDYITRHRSFREMVALAETATKGEPRSTATAEDLWRAFPRGYVGAWLDDRLIGWIQLWPLDARRAGDFLVGARSERELTEDDLATVCNSPRTVWYFSGMLLAPEWRGRGLAAHLFAEAMVRWYRDLPWRLPLHFTALAASREGMGFVEGFGMRPMRAAEDMADGHPAYARVLRTEEELREVVRSARAAADRKGRLVDPR